jgi:hypothetical protein
LMSTVALTTVNLTPLVPAARFGGVQVTLSMISSAVVLNLGSQQLRPCSQHQQSQPLRSQP